MTPRSGGEAEKIGHRYEGTWTVGRVLEVLQGEAESLRIEPLGDLGKGVEFVLTRGDGSVEAHQVKRQYGQSNSWNVSAFTSLGVWAAAERHAGEGRDYHFVSMLPYRDLQELAERVRNSQDLPSLIHGSLPGGSDVLFTQLGDLYRTPENAYRILKRFHIRVIDEIEQQRGNAAIAELLLEGGGGKQLRAVLSEVVDHSIDIPLTADAIDASLRSYQVTRKSSADHRSVSQAITTMTADWVRRTAELLMTPVIERTEVAQIQNLLSQPKRIHFVAGPAGGGKTGVLHQTVAELVHNEVPTLVLRMDRYGHLASTAELGEVLGLGMSPVAGLAASARGERCVLVIDQLDAVSLVSGRLPDNFDIVSDLVAEAAAVDSMHIILGCRQFDIDNDHRMRTLQSRTGATTQLVSSLTDEQVRRAIAAIGLDSNALTAGQFEILRLPLHLSLLASVPVEPSSLAFSTTQTLFDAYWDHKRRAVRQRRTSTRFDQVTGRLADVISERQELSVPIAVLDADDLADDSDVLVSEQVLIRDGAKVAFFHEALFDYAFARHWTTRRSSVHDFLTSGEQELFRRAQVRQILTHLRATEPGRFVDEVQELLTSVEIRVHIKDVILSLVGGLPDPTVAEAVALVRSAETIGLLSSRIWARLAHPAWFRRLCDDGLLEEWLAGDQMHQDWALRLMASSAGLSGRRLHGLLSSVRATPHYGEWFRAVISGTEIKANPQMFDLLLDAVARGYFEGHEEKIWFLAQGLTAEAKITLLSAYLNDRASSFEVDRSGRIVALKAHDYLGSELIREAAGQAPFRFVQHLLPYVVTVIERTALKRSDEALPRDTNFSLRYPNFPNDDLGEVLFGALTDALRSAASSQPEQLSPILDHLSASLYDSTQWLLYQALTAGEETYAERAGSLLLEGRHRLLCGDASHSLWATRLLLQELSPYFSDLTFARLEDQLRYLRLSWEKPGTTASAFCLLSAMDELRLSDMSRARLQELRRAFGTDQPSEPVGIVELEAGSPIPDEATARMTDTNWLQAMAKHGEEQNGSSFFGNGARELAQSLQSRASENPDRFARLAVSLTSSTNPVYSYHLLIGLGEGAPGDPDLVFAAVRHIASLGQGETDRWLAFALQKHLRTVPLDIVDLLLQRLQTRRAPEDGAGNVSMSRGNWDSLRFNGMNSTRGSLAEGLANLLALDVDGSRADLIVSVLPQLAHDPSIAVRVNVARIVEGAVRRARIEGFDAFEVLLQTDDSLLASPAVRRLVSLVGGLKPDLVAPVLRRMLHSQSNEVRQASGELAVVAAAEWNLTDHLGFVLSSSDSAAHAGAATAAAYLLPRTLNVELVKGVLTTALNSSQPDVQTSAAKVTDSLRVRPLLPFRDIIMTLINSPSFVHALPRLLITLETAPDQVDELVLACVERAAGDLGADIGNIQTSAAHHGYRLGQVVVRALAQSKIGSQRGRLLDVLDRLIVLGAYGVDEMIDKAER
ncbi:hypothetical protein ACFCV3_02055 [Kribbella sp. NPDC056345]|uniref:hypothetical protein n=1 Tax=Kribbella sp. NPDC056345 TaxID=3345789 RepID=UPI0035D905FE